ncbi:MAG: GNAT family N-acetyltransferase [Eggerthellaceae bacterium]|jgi:RimJ/RimL family protein N-acetyltransferase
MGVSFVPVQTPHDQKVLADLAQEIWTEYWPAIIGKAQTDYMVNKFQSKEAIEEAMADQAFEYWFLVADDKSDVQENTYTTIENLPQSARIVGYTGGYVVPETKKFFISKIYLRSSERGKHFASDTIRFYVDLCKKRNLSAMYLTVNKRNELAQRAYIGNGFRITEAMVNDIGSGFVMDDYIMQKDLA